MGDMTTSTVDPRSAVPLIRPNATVAVRASDPTKERFEVGDNKVDNQQESSAVDDEAGQFAVAVDEDANNAAYASAQTSGRSARGGRGLLEAFTNFLAKIFTQDDSSSSAASTRLVGIDAYGRTNAQTATETLSGYGNDVQSPGFPRLASGRILDLSV